MLLHPSRQLRENIRTVRVTKNISQRALANAFNGYPVRLTQQDISKIESGQREVSAIELKRIAEVLQIDLNDLLYW